MKLDSKIYVAGHTGLVGSALVRALSHHGFQNIMVRPSHDLDLRDELRVDDFFRCFKPEYVFLAAAKVGGIQGNIDSPASFIYDNLQIQNTVIHACHTHGVKKLLFLGSSCIYPKYAPIPIREESLLTGPLEPTNEPYAVAKIAGIKLCQAYRDQYGMNSVSLMPTNLYGPYDNFSLSGHVVASLIAKFVTAQKHEYPEVEVWGRTGGVSRELMHVDDLAEACLVAMATYDDPEPINVGSGAEISILELAELISDLSGFKGKIILNSDMPEGTPRKLLDSTKMRKLGWSPKISLKQGLAETIGWYEMYRKTHGLISPF